MTSNVPARSGPCNTSLLGSSPPLASPTENNQNPKKCWCFTLNNYSEPEHKELLSKLIPISNFIIGEEIGEEGTPHLQGVISFYKKIRFTGVKKLMPRAHIEPCKNLEASKKYCMKEDNYVNTWEDPRMPFYLLNTFKGVTWKPWQKSLLNSLEEEPNDRKVTWIWDTQGGVGKSFLTKYIYLLHNAIIADGKKSDVFNQIKVFKDLFPSKNPEVIILDIPRNNQKRINYGMLESIKNGLIYSGKYEGGCCCFPPPHVVIFANCPPEVEQMSMDRWEIICLDPVGESSDTSPTRGEGVISNDLTLSF